MLLNKTINSGASWREKEDSFSSKFGCQIVEAAYVQ